MALFEEGMLCHICRSPMTAHQELLGFPHIASGNPVIAPFDDSVCHQQCLSQWRNRDRFIHAWNRETFHRFITWSFLDVNAYGRVHFLTAFGGFLNALSVKQSDYLPRVSRDRPLVRMCRPQACTTPFRVKNRFSFSTRATTAQQLGATGETSAAVDLWSAEYRSLDSVQFHSRSRLVEQWKSLSARGYDLWKKLCEEIGDHYRIVYVKPGAVYEPESLEEGLMRNE